MPAPHPQLRELIQSTAVQTDAGKLHWMSNGPASTSFDLQLAGGAMRIISIDGDGQAPYELTVFNEEGVVVERVSSEDDMPIQATNEIERLYVAARRAALGVSTTIKSLLDEIQGDDIPF